jgi:sortase (surface protein transpeptidase)
MSRGQRGAHAARRPGPAGPAPRHGGPARPFRALMRRPVAASLMCGGLLAAGGGVGGLMVLAGHPGVGPRPVAAPARAPAGVVTAPPRPVASGKVAAPSYLSIPAAGVHTSLIKLGLTADGSLQVPTSTSVAGWYTGSPRPGQTGSAIIAGHIDSTQGPGVFFRLRLLRPGDRVYVRHADGTLAVFRVYAEHMYAKNRFPTERVYGPVPDPELRLITCGGMFDPATGSYLSNVVVYAAEIR